MMTPKLISSNSKTSIGFHLCLLLLFVVSTNQYNHASSQPLDDLFAVVPVGEANLGMYYVNVSLGSPPQTFRLLLNTGSADSWIYSRLMSGQSTCGMAATASGGRASYDVTASQSAQSDGRRAEIFYGNKALVRGQVTRDSFTIGGLQVANVTFLAVDHCLGDYLDQVEVDGVLGLGGSLSQLQSMGADLIVKQGHQQNRLNAPVFSLDLKPGSMELILGERPSSSSVARRRDVPVFVPTSDSKHWQIQVKLELQSEASAPVGNANQMADVDWHPVNTDALRSMMALPHPAVLDSSTNFIVLPSILAFIVNKHIGAKELSLDPFDYDNQLGFADCSLEGRPTVVFEAVGADQRQPIKFVVTPEEYVIKIENHLVDTNYSCISAFMIHRESRNQQIIFGNLILSKYLTIFDALNESIGFRAH